MRCRNCGAHYRLRDLACPYCGTENIIGRIWQKQRSDAEEEYERKRKEAGKLASPYVYNRAVNRVLLVEGLFFVLVIIGCILVFGVLEFADTEHKAGPEELQSLYEEGRYGEMYKAMQNDYDAYEDPQRKVYMQAGLMYRTYVNYQTNKMAFFAMTEEEKKKDDYHLEYSFREGCEVMTMRFGYYDELEPSNQKIYDEYSREIRAYFLGTLKLTEEEIAEILEADYLYQEDVDRYIKKVRDRNGW